MIIETFAMEPRSAGLMNFARLRLAARSACGVLRQEAPEGVCERVEGGAVGELHGERGATALVLVQTLRELVAKCVSELCRFGRRLTGR